VRDGGDVEDGKRIGQDVVAKRAFIAERLAWVNVAFRDEVGVEQKGFQFGQNGFESPANSAKPIKICPSSRKLLHVSGR